jgi:hypothetical protein
MSLITIWNFTYISKYAANNVHSKQEELIGKNYWGKLSFSSGHFNRIFRETIKIRARSHADLRLNQCGLILIFTQLIVNNFLLQKQRLNKVHLYYYENSDFVFVTLQALIYYYGK